MPVPRKQRAPFVRTGALVAASYASTPSIDRCVIENLTGVALGMWEAGTR